MSRLDKTNVMKAQKKNPLFDPRLCQYKLNPYLREHVSKVLESSKVIEATKKVIEEIMKTEESNKNTLNYESLVKLHKYLQRADPEYSDPFYKFSSACKCIEPKARENEKLDERLKELRLKSSQAMYDKMTSAVDRQVAKKLEQLNLNSPNEGTTVTEFKNLYGSVIAVFNSFLVYICTFIFCYKALEYSMVEPNVTLQVAFGFAGSLVVAIAEVYFLLRVV